MQGTRGGNDVPAVCTALAAAAAGPAVAVVPPRARLAYARPMTGATEDTALMLRYAESGDVAAFERLYRRHNDALFRYLLRLGNDRDTAADLFQEVWTRIIRARRRYRASARFSTYLYRVARNAFIDHLRRNKRYGKGPDDDPDQRPDTGDGPEVLTERALARERLFGALAELPFEQRDAFLLHEEGGLGIDDIAAVTGVPRETAKSRLRYAFAKLRTALDDPAARDRPKTERRQA